MALGLVWQREGQETSTQRVVFPITFPSRTSEAIPVTLRSSARDHYTFEVLMGVRFYLTGTDVPAVQEQWPYLGSAFTPERPELNGGFEVSFDNGRTWTRFTKTCGYESDPTTWVPLPADAIGLNGTAEQLGPFDQAHLLVRYVVPPQAAEFKVLDIHLAVDCDVV